MVGVDPFKVLNRETEAMNHKIVHVPEIIRFLGYNPTPEDGEARLCVRLKAHHLEMELSLKRLAKQLNIGECNIRKLGGQKILKSQLRMHLKTPPGLQYFPDMVQARHPSGSVLRSHLSRSQRGTAC